MCGHGPRRVRGLWGDDWKIRSDINTLCILSYFHHVWLFAISRTIARQTPLSMGFSRQECWSGLPFLSPGDLPNPGIKSRSPTPQADSLPPEPRGKPFSRVCVTSYKEPKTSAEKHPLANGRILESTCGHQRHVSLQKTSSFLLRNHHFWRRDKPVRSRCWVLVGLKISLFHLSSPNP